MVQAFVAGAFSVEAYPMTELLAKEWFSIEKVEDLSPEADGSLLKIYFRAQFKPEPGARNASARRPRQGWILVVPNDGWAIREYQVQYANLSTGKLRPVGTAGVVDYQASDAGSRVPKHVTIRHLIKLEDGKKEEKLPSGVVLHDGEQLSVETFEFDHFDFTAEPESSFTLAAFGLPDVQRQGSTPRGRSTGLWFLASAAVSLLVALLLKEYARRRRAQVEH